MSKIQYNNNSHNVKHLLRTYWANVLSTLSALCYVILTTTL